MNELNYCGLEMSKKVVEHGIVLETEKWWHYDDPRSKDDPARGCYGEWEIVEYKTDIPAANLSELLRELPERFAVSRKTRCLHIEKWKGETYASYENYGLAKNKNPCDALAELLIWIRKEKP